jgi:hypothetical protein
MPEDAPGNPAAGRAGQPAGLARLRKVREMQAKLHRCAGEDHSRRFGDLCNLVCDPDFLAEAWFRTLSVYRIYSRTMAHVGVSLRIFGELRHGWSRAGLGRHGIG